MNRRQPIIIQFHEYFLGNVENIKWTPNWSCTGVIRDIFQVGSDIVKGLRTILEQLLEKESCNVWYIC